MRKHPYNQWCPDAVALDVLGGKWTFPILRELASGPVRFVDLQRQLHVSTESLRTRLNQLVADGVLVKTRYREVPPRTDYELTTKGRAALPVLRALADFALQTDTWQEAEGWLNIGSNLRLAAAGYQPRRALAGVTHVLAGEFEYTLVLTARGGGGGVYTGSPPAVARATIEGSVPAWTDALGPSADASTLRFGGDTNYAKAVMSWLTKGAAWRA